MTLKTTVSIGETSQRQQTYSWEEVRDTPGTYLCASLVGYRFVSLTGSRQNVLTLHVDGSVTVEHVNFPNSVFIRCHEPVSITFQDVEE